MLSFRIILGVVQLSKLRWSAKGRQKRPTAGPRDRRPRRAALAATLAVLAALAALAALAGLLPTAQGCAKKREVKNHTGGEFWTLETDTNPRRYLYVERWLTWDEARKACEQQHNSTLAFTPCVDRDHLHKVLHYVLELYGDDPVSVPWLGLSRDAPEKPYRTVNGEEPADVLWIPGFPIEGDPEDLRQCALFTFARAVEEGPLHSHGQVKESMGLVHNPCRLQRPFLCELPPLDGDGDDD